MATLLFLGPLPPPVHGFSLINSQMHEKLAQRIEVFALSRGRISVRDIGIFLSGLLRARFRSAYVGLSGGYGQLVDIVFIALLRLFGINVFIHHHSFSYINTSSFFSRFIFSFLRHCQHVALCELMANSLCRLYGVSPQRIRVLSNACFLSVPALPSKNFGSRVLRVGFLSNITEEKGIFDFFEVMNVLSSAHFSIEGVVAGPIDAAIRSRFDSCLTESQTVQHLGPVYADAKQHFYEDIDVLLFPTKYVNEAEPVTVLEAMSHGVLVVARSRGCIAGMVDGVGHVFSEAEFVDRTLDLLAELSRNPADQAAVNIQSVFIQRREHAAQVLERLLYDITGVELKHE